LTDNASSASIRSMAPKRTPTEAPKGIYVRLNAKLYNAVSDAATLSNTSMNSLISETLENNFLATSTGVTPTDVLNASRVAYASTVSMNTPVNTTLTAVVNTAISDAISKLAGKEKNV
jgi:predicted HicB family RNase H-like nuclease